MVGGLSMWYWKTQISYFFFLNNQLDPQKLDEMKHNKNLPSSYCAAVAFLWTETLLHSETLKSTKVEQAPCMISYYSSNPDPKVYRVVLYKLHPFFWSILNKRLPVSFNVRTVQQNLLLLTRKQFHVIKIMTCAVVQKQSYNY